MPRYIYTAKSHPSKTVQGEVEANSEEDAISRLTKMGYFPIWVRPYKLSFDKQRLSGFHKVSNKDIILFTRQLSSLIESGVNILTGLDIIYNQSTNKYLKIILDDIISKIKDGKTLSDSLAQYPRLFSSLYTSIIHSGEVGGTLEQTLKRLSDFLEKEEEFKNSIRSALAYPSFVFAVGIFTVIILLGFVIPTLVTMFEEMGQALPLPTRILIGVSGFLRSYWWLIFALAVTLVFFLRRLYHSQEGKIFWHSLKLKILIFGQIALKSEISRLMRTLSLLLSSGIPIISSITVSTLTIDNQILKIELQKITEQIKNGLSFSHSLKDSKLFPSFITSIITVGEETGTLEKSLMRIADDYEREVDRTLKTLSRLLEPIIILFVGLVVGFIVLSMLLPIFQMNLIVR